MQRSWRVVVALSLLVPCAIGARTNAQRAEVPESEPEPDAEAVPEPGPESEPEPEAGPEPESEPEPEAGPEAGPEAAPDPSTAVPPAPPQPEIVVEQLMAAQAVYQRNPGSKLSDALALPSGAIEIGGELALLTSSATLAGDSIAFTDVGLLRLRARKSFAGQLELFASSQLLAKKPSASDAGLWQGALAGAQWLFTPELAVSLQAGGGPVLDAGDGYLTVGTTLSTKQKVDYHVHFELGLGYALTALDLAARDDALFHVHEANAYVEVQLGNRSGGMFARFAYHLPFASGPSAERSPGRYLDPSVELDVQIGAVLVAGEHHDWDIYGVCAIVDHGEHEDPATTLPILDGGFDQQQWTVGVQHRFDADPRTGTDD